MATLKDIARLAGVSVSTVSRSLRDQGRIPLETRQRIKDLALEHNLELNSAARSLSTQRTQTVGLVYPEFENGYHKSSYLDLLVHELRIEMTAKGFDCLIFQAEGPVTSNITRLVRQKKIDGLILIMAETQKETWDVLEKVRFPLVQVHTKPLFRGTAPRGENFDYFYTDNHMGGQIAGRHLLEAGCSNPICLGDEIHVPEMLERTRGFMDALLEAGIRPTSGQVLNCSSSFDGAYKFVLQNADLFRSVDGIFAHTDLMAVAVLQALSDSGRRVPNQVKVIGFDDVPLCRMVRPSLTTIHQPREEQAKRASQRLVEIIEEGPQDPLVQEYLPPSLVVRGSTKGDFIHV